MFLYHDVIHSGITSDHRIESFTKLNNGDEGLAHLFIHCFIPHPPVKLVAKTKMLFSRNVALEEDPKTNLLAFPIGQRLRAKPRICPSFPT